ncbi:NUDIX domain-containing protein [Flavobacterium sp. LB3P122]|uniref:NUDIX domain-containing protein n=1 Tax=Flavobacterium algoriphilum TaxID=3398738 RepID=UPI003A88C1B0
MIASYSDGQYLKLLIIKRSFELFKGEWSLVGGFLEDDESAEATAVRALNGLAGLDGLYMEQLKEVVRSELFRWFLCFN